MNCREVNRYLYAFLDNETALKETLEIQEHLEHCPTCRRAFELERGLRIFLQREIGDEEPPRDLWAKIAERLTAEARPFGLRRRTARISLAKRVSALLFGLLLLLLAGLPHQDGLPLLQAPSTLAQLLEAHLRPLMTPSGKAPTEAALTASVGRTAFTLELAPLKWSGLRLIGEKLCVVHGERGRQFAFSRDGQRISLYVFRELVVDFAGARRQSVGGKDFYVFGFQGYRIVFWKEGDLLCVAVAEMGEEELMQVALLFDRALHV